MLRTSLRSVSGPLRRHVCPSGGSNLRRFHPASVLRAELCESESEVQSPDASTEPPVQVPQNVQSTSDAPKTRSPMDIPRWNSMNYRQRCNFKKNRKSEYAAFRTILYADDPGFWVRFERFKEFERRRSEAAQSEGSQAENLPRQADLAQKRNTRDLLREVAAATPEKAAIILKRAKVVDLKLLAAKLKEEDATNSVRNDQRTQEEDSTNSVPDAQRTQDEEEETPELVAKVFGHEKQSEDENPPDVATKAPAEKPFNGIKKNNAQYLKRNSNIVSQVLESSPEDSFTTFKPPMRAPAHKPRPRAPVRQPKVLTRFGKHVMSREMASISAGDLKLEAVDVPMAPVPGVSFGLDRVLFNPGVYELRDPRSRVYNFDPYLDQIMPVTEFDFETLKPYVTSSKDVVACEMAAQQKKKYYGSSSSMTSALSHFHYLLSSWRPIDTRHISQGFSDNLRSFTRLLRAPTAMFLHYKEKEDVYAIDADKEYDSANILMNLGKSMEKLLTLPKEEFERYRRTSENKITAEEEENVPESYHYTGVGNFLMRSQLDAYDPRLPGTGMFDLKTRAVVSIRMDAANHELGMGYEIKSRFGMYESYEREYFDMIRAAFLKYSLQVRVGRMDGIFVAYHNIERIFGFQYISLPEMDQSLHGQSNTALGDKEFTLSLGLWEKVLDRATRKFPKKSLRFHFETRDGQTPFMYIFAQPVTPEEIHAIQTKNQAEIEAFQEKLFNPEKFAKQEVETEISSETDSSTDKPAIDPITESDRQPEPEAASEPSGGVSEPVDPILVSSDQPAETEAEAQADTIGIQEPESPEPEKPEDYVEDLLAMTLMVENKVNGRYVDRPKKLKEKDDWTVEYELDELSVERGNELLRMCKRRRRLVLDKTAEDASNDRNNEYLRKLRDLAEQGRNFRRSEDQKDQERGVVVYEDLSQKAAKA